MHPLQRSGSNGEILLYFEPTVEVRSKLCPLVRFEFALRHARNTTTAEEPPTDGQPRAQVLRCGDAFPPQRLNRLARP